MLPRHSILAVDDSPDSLLLIQGVLGDGYQVTVVDNGLDALKTAMTEPRPDLILLDIMMPGMDGYEVCRQLKADPASCDIPVIFLTGKAEVDDEKMGFDLGAEDYIVKPMSPLILMALADVYDALISRRVYKEPIPHVQAVKIIEQCRGKHFDPDVVDAFMELQDNFRAIAHSEANADIQRKVDYIEVALK